jgi:thiosulfate reductase cytochrome b subunit
MDPAYPPECSSRSHLDSEFGGRQSARSIHFLTMLSFLAFLVRHVTLVVMTGFARNMNHIVMGTDDQGHSWNFTPQAGCT